MSAAKQNSEIATVPVAARLRIKPNPKKTTAAQSASPKYFLGAGGNGIICECRISPTIITVPPNAA